MLVIFLTEISGISTAVKAGEDALKYMLKCMQQELQPKLLKDISEMAANKSFDCRARFGAIYSGSKTKEYLFKNDRPGELFQSEGQFIPGKISYYRVNGIGISILFYCQNADRCVLVRF